MWLEIYINKLKSGGADAAESFLVGRGALITHPIGEENPEPALTVLTVSLFFDSEITPEVAEEGISRYMNAVNRLGLNSESVINPDCRSCVMLPLGQAAIAYYNSLMSQAKSRQNF